MHPLLTIPIPNGCEPDPPGYAVANVIWEVLLSADNPPLATKLKTKHKEPLPGFGKGSGKYCYPVSDSVKHFEFDAEVETQSPPHQWAVEIHQQMLEDMPDCEPLVWLLRDLQSGAISEALAKEKAKASERVVFLSGLPAKTLHQRPDVMAWVAAWAKAKEKTPKDVDLVDCPLLGRVAPALTTPTKGVTIGNQPGVKFFSCNISTSESFGNKVFASVGVSQEGADRFMDVAIALMANRDSHFRIGDTTYLYGIPGGGIIPQHLLAGMISPPSTEANAEEEYSPGYQLRLLKRQLKGLKEGVVVDGAGSMGSAIIVQPVRHNRAAGWLEPPTSQDLGQFIECLTRFHGSQLTRAKYSSSPRALALALERPGAKQPPPWLELAFLAMAHRGECDPRIAEALVRRTMAEGLPIGDDMDGRAWKRLTIIRLIEEYQVMERSPQQEQAYLIGQLYSYLCYLAKQKTDTSKNSVAQMRNNFMSSPLKSYLRLYQIAPNYYVKGNNEDAETGEARERNQKRVEGLMRKISAIGPLPRRWKPDCQFAFIAGTVALNKKTEATEAAEPAEETLVAA